MSATHKPDWRATWHTYRRLLGLLRGGQARVGRPGERLARAFERLGPVSIKLGQLLSTRADIFGATFAADLAHLKDRLPPFPLRDAEGEIAASLAGPSLGPAAAESPFARIEPAVAAASLAQAHPAWLKDGRKGGFCAEVDWPDGRKLRHVPSRADPNIARNGN